MNSPLAISVRGLVRSFNGLRVVDGIDLDVPEGMIFAILGPNGAGKTTLLRMLATLLAPEAGSATIMGHDLAEDPQGVRASIAMTGQFASLDEDLTGEENLVLFARLSGFSKTAARQRSRELLAAFELEEAANRQVRSYSGGMRRRLDIAASLIVTPGILFLDEPTTGLDPTARQRVWRLVRELARTGVTILLTTQYLEEADQLAQRIAVLDHGRKIAEGSSRELKAAVGAGVLKLTLADEQRIAEATRLLESLSDSTINRSGDDTLAMVIGSAAEASRLLAVIIDSGIDITDFSMGSPSLEEVFFALTSPRAKSPGSGSDADA